MVEAAESQILDVIRVWAAIAWADGALAPAEAEGLRRLVRNAELTGEERAAASRFVAEPVAMPETYLTNLSPLARHGVYRAACRVAVVDHVFTQSERRVLDRLRELLGIPEDGAREIEAGVPGLVAL
jgi:tellurite resistance protein